MKLKILSLPGAEAFSDRLADKLDAARCGMEVRHFPDGETYLRVLDDVSGRDVAVVAQLREPDAHLPALLFAADTLRELGAASVGLVAPYLPYMRQDVRFLPGEAVTSRTFARLLSQAYGWIVTVDPHLHRNASLDTLYHTSTEIVPSAPAVAAWVQTRVSRPALVGPDAESLQWVSQVAAMAGCPHLVLGKRRMNDGEVILDVPDLHELEGRTPVLLDDIISSGGTMAAAIHALRGQGLPAPVCVGVHAVFAGDAAQRLILAGAARVVTCNTLAHATNGIDVSGALAEAVRIEIEAVHAGSEEPL